MKCQPIGDLSTSEYKSFLDSFDTVLCDCDGVLYRGHGAIEGSAEAIRVFEEDLGKKVIYVTNNSIFTREQYVEKFKKLGFTRITEEQIIHTGLLAAMYLKKINFEGKAYVIGRQGITEELKSIGIESIVNKIDETPHPFDSSVTEKIIDEMDPDVKCVVVGYDCYITYVKMMKAASYLNREGAVLIASDVDATFPIANGRSLPGSGPGVRAVETASGMKAVVVGKPSKFVFECVQMLFPEVKAERAVMIGDRSESDVEMGKNAGLRTILVGSGLNSYEDVLRWEKEGNETLTPHYYADCLGDVTKMAKNL